MKKFYVVNANGTVTEGVNAATGFNAGVDARISTDSKKGSWDLEISCPKTADMISAINANLANWLRTRLTMANPNDGSSNVAVNDQHDTSFGVRVPGKCAITDSQALFVGKAWTDWEARNGFNSSGNSGNNGGNAGKNGGNSGNNGGNSGNNGGNAGKNGGNTGNNGGNSGNNGNNGGNAGKNGGNTGNNGGNSGNNGNNGGNAGKNGGNTGNNGGNSGNNGGNSGNNGGNAGNNGGNSGNNGGNSGNNGGNSGNNGGNTQQPAPKKKFWEMTDAERERYNADRLNYYLNKK